MGKKTDRHFLIIFLLLICPFHFGIAKVIDNYQFQSHRQQMLFQHLTSELRCLVCQNQNLAESNAPLAADLRKIIANKIQLHQNPKNIINYLVARYGDYILYKPPLNKETFVLWFAPFILLTIGLLVLILLTRYKSSSIGKSAISNKRVS